MAFRERELAEPMRSFSLEGPSPSRYRFLQTQGTMAEMHVSLSLALG